MIRFRIGQSWKREPTATPVDSFGLDLDGVDLLTGASEEPLTSVVPELLEAISQLVLEGEHFSQLSLTEAHLEVAFQRKDSDVLLRLVSLSRPARLLRPPVRLDLLELTEAAVKCGRTLLRDLGDIRSPLLKSAAHRKMARRLTALESPALKATRRTYAKGGFTQRAPAHSEGSFGFELVDPDDLILGLGRKGQGALNTLMFGGSTWFRAQGTDELWRADGHPFLFALELSRQASELVHALEVDDAEFRFSPAGQGPELRVDLRAGKVAVGDRSADVQPHQLARNMFELGHGLALTVADRNKAQLKNPYLSELITRCREGLSHLKSPTQASGGARKAETPKRRGRAGKPLVERGRLRKLQFAKLWEKQNLGGEGAGRLLLTPQGPLFSALEMACAFSTEGELLFRRVATHGVAAGPDGWVLAADAQRVLGFYGTAGSARWMRDHDGVVLGPELDRKNGLCVTALAGRGAVAFQEKTGREMWRVAPARTQRSFLSVQGNRVLVTTDSGYLFGLELADGQVRYRMRSALPFLGAGVPWGKKFLATLGRADRCVLFAADVEAGTVAWTQEMSLSSPSRPLADARRIHLAGEREGEGVLCCLGKKGETLWERKLHLGRGPFALAAWGRSVLAVAQSGAAAMVSSDGRLEWRLGPFNVELPRLLPPVVVRGVAVIPGDTVRAVEPRGGRVLAEVQAGTGLCDLKVDSKLNLFLLDEEGALRAYRLASHMALLNGG